MERKEICYLAVAKPPTGGAAGAVLAERVHIPSTTIDFRDHVVKVLHSPGWVDVTSDKISLQDGEYKFHVLRCEDDGLVFIAVATVTYPIRYVFGTSDSKGCLTELRSDFLGSFSTRYKKAGDGELTQPASLLLKNICKLFNDLRSIDKLERVKAQVSEVATLMHKNVDAAADLADKMELVSSRSEDLQMLSKSFEAEMTATQKTMKKKHTKLAILLFIVVASMLAIGIIAYISVREKRHGGVTPSNSTSNSTVG